MWRESRTDKAHCVSSLAAGKVGATAAHSESGRMLASGNLEDSHFHSQNFNSVRFLLGL